MANTPNDFVNIIPRLKPKYLQEQRNTPATLGPDSLAQNIRAPAADEDDDKEYQDAIQHRQQPYEDPSSSKFYDETKDMKDRRYLKDKARSRPQQRGNQDTPDSGNSDGDSGSPKPGTPPPQHQTSPEADRRYREDLQKKGPLF